MSPRRRAGTPEAPSATDVEPELDAAGDGQDPGDFDGEEQDVESLQTPPPTPRKFAPRDPSEVMRDADPDTMTAGQRAAAARQLGVEKETSLDRAKNEILRRREMSSRAVLFRLEPEEYRGKKIKGQIRKWVAPFVVDEIEDYARDYRGGGKYRIQFFDGNGDFSTSEEFDVEGDPILPGEIDEPEAARPRRGTVVPGEDRAAALERQLQEERFERRLSEQQSATNMMFERLTAAIEKVSAPKPPEPPKTDLTGLLGTLAPLAMKFLEGQQAQAAAAREAALAAVKAQAEAQQKQSELLATMQEKAETRMAKVLAELKPKETLVDNMKVMAEMKKVFGADDPMKVLRDTWPAMIKMHMETMNKIELHKAGVGNEKEETFAERALGSLTDLAEQALPALLARPTTQPVAPYGQPAAPGLPAPQQPGAAARAGGPIVTPEQQAAHESAEKAAKAAKVAAAPVVGAPPVTPTPEAAPAEPPPTQPAPLAMLANFGISPVVFERGLKYLAEGKGGDELAHDCVTEEETHRAENPQGPAKLLSAKFIQYISRNVPEDVLKLLLPYLQPYPEAAPLLDPLGQSFLADFCKYFSEPVEDGEEEVQA